MKVSLFGNGKIGKLIASELYLLGHQVSFIIDSKSMHLKNQISKDNTDVIIDFTNPDAVTENIFLSFDKCIPIVVGTTGWYNQFENISDICLTSKKSLFYASNFSVGVNNFFRILTYSTALFKTYHDYNISIEEVHHLQKIDAPSGTAISIAEIIIENQDKYTGWELVENENYELKDGIIPIYALREENIVGTHKVYFKSINDAIILKHDAYNRAAFVEGAIKAAEWIIGKQGVFTMKDMLH